MKFVQKPVVVEANQFLPPHHIPCGVEFPKPNLGGSYGWVKTARGGAVISPGDWLVQTSQGLIPVKDQQFRLKYSEYHQES